MFPETLEQMNLHAEAWAAKGGDRMRPALEHRGASPSWEVVKEHGPHRECDGQRSGMDVHEGSQWCQGSACS